MKTTGPVKSDRTRQRILEAAAVAFREHGVDRVGVRDVMQLAGLTRGGFYFHFADKDALLAEATREGGRANAAVHLEWTEGLPSGERLQAFIHRYLSEAHRDHPEIGCTLAALGGEIARSKAAQRRAFSEGLDAVIDGLMPLLPHADEGDRRKGAELLIASMAGVIAMARSLSDRRRSNELLASARRFYADAFSK